MEEGGARERAVSARVGGLCQIMIGRQHELGVLQDALLVAECGQGQFILVAGDAGLGKTRLVSEFRSGAEESGFTVLTGSCPQATLSLPYLPFLEAFGNQLAGKRAAAIRKKLGSAARVLARLLPQLGTEPEPDGEDPAQARIRLYEAVLTLLRTLESEAGVLFILEDLQWADSSTRELLDYLARRMRHSRLLVVATYRSGEVDRRHPMSQLTQSWRRAGLARQVDLLPLTSVEAAAMMQSILGSAPPRGLKQTVVDHSEGNPLVLEELLKTTEGAEPDGSRSLKVPDTIADSILERMRRMSPPQIEILRAAAIVGANFTQATAAGVARVSVSEVRESLQACESLQLVLPGDDSDAYRFRHAVTREVIYRDIPSMRREELHSAAADLLAGRPDSEPVDIARHLLAAGRLQEAVPVCVKAAQRAAARGGFREAEGLYRLALPHMTDALDRGELLCRLGEATYGMGEAVTATAQLNRGIALLERAGHASKAAKYRLVLGTCHWQQRRPDLAATEIERARLELEKSPASEDLARAYALLAALRVFDMDGGSADGLATRAMEIAAAVGSDVQRTFAEIFLGIATIERGDINAGIEHLDRSFKAASAKNLDWISVNAVYNGISARLDHLRAAECPALIRRMRKVAIGRIREVWLADATAHTSLLLGEPAVCVETCREWLPVAQDAGAAAAAVRFQRLLALGLAEVGEVTEALALAPPPRKLQEHQEELIDLWTRLRVHIAAGNRAEATRLARALGRTHRWMSREGVLLALCVEALPPGRLAVEGRDLVDKAIEMGIDANDPYVLQAQARIALAAGSPAVAARDARASVIAFSKAGYRLEEMRSRLVLAEVLFASGTADEAGMELRVVATSASSCSATVLGEMAAAAAERMHIGPLMVVPLTAKPDEEEFDEESRGPIILAGRLRQALPEREFALHYQPKLDLRTRSMDSVEALLRWQRPEQPLLSAQRFIALAEGTGLITEITRWVVSEALTQAKLWQRAGRRIEVAVNFSVRDLEGVGFAQGIDKAISAAGVDPTLFCMELTETTLMSEPKRALECLRELRALGVKISIDDFGTGHSALAYLKRLPADELKIDRSFCMDMDASDRAIVASIVRMGHELGLKVVAEGVESEDTAARLAHMGCDLGQGYALGRPVPARDIIFGPSEGAAGAASAAS